MHCEACGCFEAYAALGAAGGNAANAPMLARLRQSSHHAVGRALAISGKLQAARTDRYAARR